MNIKTLRLINQSTKYPFSESSLQKLIGVHYDLIIFAFELANVIDCKIVYGVRTDPEQYQLFLDKKSSFDGITKRSSHQINMVTKLGHGLDILPLPKGVNMYLDDGSEDNIRWGQFDGLCHGIAHGMGIKIKTGFKWRDNMMDSLARNERDNTFPDGNHVELII